MKNKAPLALMEQLIMVLVFALAAALCLQVYVFSAQVSRRCEAQSFAATAVQNVAERLKADSGNLDTPLMGFDENWQETDSDQAAYHILVQPEETDVPGLGKATVSARTHDGEDLFAVAVCWQEERHEK